MEPSRQEPEAIRAMFDRIAPRYDLLNRIISGGFDAAWRKQAAAELAVAPAGPRLDLCAGTLDVSALLAASGERVVAVDMSREMLARGQAKAPGVEIVVGDVCALPFADAIFGGAVCAFGARNVRDLARFAREALRVLRPGGLLVVLEAFRPARPLAAWLHRAYVGRAFPALGAVLMRERAAYRYFAESVASFVSRAELEGLLEKEGFAEARGRDLTLGMAGLVVARRSSS